MSDNYKATVKLIVSGPDQKRVVEFLGRLFGAQNAEPDVRITDWGFVATGHDTRAFPREVEVDSDFIELRNQVRADDNGPDPNLEVEELEQEERRREYESYFDRI